MTGAAPLDGPSVAVAVPDIALVGALTPGREGTVTAAAADSGFTLFVRGDGVAGWDGYGDEYTGNSPAQVIP